MGEDWGGTRRSRGKGNIRSTYYIKNLVSIKRKLNKTDKVEPKMSYQNLLL